MIRAAWIALALAAAGVAAAEDAAWQALARGGQIVLLRHASTEPGSGDPPGFRIDDCATQRNLSAAGRREAERLGGAFRSRAVRVARVLSSPWCRCLDTAELAFGLRPATHPALDNLYGRGENRARQVAAFRELIAEPPRGGNLVLVTHGATALALTGEYPAMGEAIVITPAGGGAFAVAGRIRAR